MLSEDDRPLVPVPDLIGHDTKVSISINGHVNGKGDQDTSMSEDEDEELPLVRSDSLIRVT